MPIDTDKLLINTWRALGYKSEIPDGLRRHFQRFVVDSYLKVNVIDVDPYAEQATVQCISDYMLAESARKISRFGLSAEKLEYQYEKWQSKKVAISWAGVVSLGIASACLIGCMGFFAGSLSADGWNNYKISKVESEEKNRQAKLDFLERVNQDLMMCKHGKILMHDGNKWCDMRNHPDAIWMIL